MAGLEHWLITVLLVSLRIVPTISFSPPFTLLRVPATVRLMLSLSLAAWIVAGHPSETSGVDLSAMSYVALFLSELTIGIGLALALQLAFAALLTVGRAVDLQAGYAFALIADPTSRSQMPLIGTIFAYAAAAIFFTTSGPGDLLAILSLSVEKVPLGAALSSDSLAVLTAYMSAVFVMAFGAGGQLLLVLFLLDLTIAMMSRTLPQMNVLFLGFQFKAIATLVMLPLVIAGSAALFLRIIRFALDTMLELI